MRATDRALLKRACDVNESTGSKVVLSNGDNTVTPPTNAEICVIAPTPESTGAMTLKGAGGDTGVSIDNIVPTILAIDPAVDASFILNSTGGGTVNIHYLSRSS
jgi:hypothetical protein